MSCSLPLTPCRRMGTVGNQGNFFSETVTVRATEMHIFIPFLHSAFISSHVTKQTPSAVSLPIV